MTLTNSPRSIGCQRTRTKCADKPFYAVVKGDRVYVYAVAVTVWLAGCLVSTSPVNAQENADSTTKANVPAKASKVTSKNSKESKESAHASPAPTNTSAPSAELSAREAVHLGNEQLLAGNAKSALTNYDHAEQLEPNAPQIAYVKGLGYFASKDFAAARAAFEKAAASDNERLASDALYGEGTTYHAEALASTDKPKVAIEKLENALEQYRTVLAHEPGHKAARDAAIKAAMLRQKLVQQLKQQSSKPNDQHKDSNKKKDDKQNNKKDEQQQEQKKKNNEQDNSQEQSSKDKKSEDQNPEQSDKTSQDDQQKQQEKQQSSDSSAKENPTDSAQAQQAKANKDDDKMAQAKRRLREMMDALRNRKKHRPAQPVPMPIKPVDKDW